MEKLLISEIKRYHEIMGIKSVILEQGKAVQAAEKFAERLGISTERVVGKGEQLLGKLESKMEQMGIPKTELESLSSMFERGAEREAEEKLTRMLENEPFRRAFVMSAMSEFPELLAKEAENFAKGLPKETREALSAIYNSEGSEGVEKFLKAQNLWNDEYADIFRAFKPAQETAVSAGGRVTREVEKDVEKQKFLDKKRQELIDKTRQKAQKGYVPTEEDYAYLENILRSARPELTESQIKKVMEKVKKLKVTGTYEEFIESGGKILENGVDKIIGQKGWFEGKAWPWMKDNPWKSAAIGALLMPATAGGILYGVSDRFRTFVCSTFREWNLDFCSGSSTGTGTNTGGNTTVTPTPVAGLQDKEEDLKKYLDKRFKNMDFSVITITKESDGSWTVKGPSATLKFVFNNGTFEKR